MLVDSHCHLNHLESIERGEPLAGVLDAAREAGVEHMLCVGVDRASWDSMMALIDGHMAVSASVGVHPNEPEGNEPDIDWLLAGAGHRQVVAIGETGLDYHRTAGDAGFQRDRFRLHIRAAREVSLPIIVHTRAAREDTIRIMQEEGAGAVGGVMHCFTEDLAMAEAAIDMGFLVSFSGIVTFRNATDLQEVARRIPDASLLVETDSPWLAPVPHRGRTNQPAWVRHVAEFIAELRGDTLEGIAVKTTGNYDRVFGRWSAGLEATL